jgi:hypothetical protein
MFPLVVLTRRLFMQYVWVAALPAWAAACRPSAPPSRPLIAVPRQMGTWEGTGSQTLGLVSDSGKFRIHWQARLAPGVGDGDFRLTVHSAVSGRPLREVVDQRGSGEGTLDFEDDPRPYNLMVESTGVVWSIAVDELVLVRPTS